GAAAVKSFRSIEIACGVDSAAFRGRESRGNPGTALRLSNAVPCRVVTKWHIPPGADACLQWRCTRMADTHDPRSVIEQAEQAAIAGDYFAAERLLRDAAAQQEATLGPFHPDLVNTLN